MTNMAPREHQPSSEQDQQKLAESIDYARMIIDAVPASGGATGESDWTSTGTVEEINAGIVPNLRVYEGPLGIVIDIEAYFTPEGDGPTSLPTDRRQQRYLISEMADGRRVLNVSPIITPESKSTTELALTLRLPSDQRELALQADEDAVARDEVRLEDYHRADASDVARLHEYLDISRLGDAYYDAMFAAPSEEPSGAMPADDELYLPADWQ